MSKMRAMDALFMAALSEEQRQRIRVGAASLQQLRKWSHFARHAKKARVRKKYKRRIRRYAEKFRLRHSGDATDYVYLPSAIELPAFICRYDPGSPGKDRGAVCWWVRTPEPNTSYGPITQKYADEKGVPPP